MLLKNAAKTLKKESKSYHRDKRTIWSKITSASLEAVRVEVTKHKDKQNRSSTSPFLGLQHWKSQNGYRYLPQVTMT